MSAYSRGVFVLNSVNVGPIACPPFACPTIDPATASLVASLWAIRNEDVVHAPKHCAFGHARAAGEVKHSNLTGGDVAFSAGELLFVGPGTIVVTGDSGRYGPRDAAEMHDVALAFRESGYIVYSLGYDADARKPFGFDLVGVPPTVLT